MSLMSRRGDTRPPTFASNGVPLESMGVCRLSLALLVLLHPTLSLGHSVPSFSGGVSNSCAPPGRVFKTVVKNLRNFCL